MLLEFRTKNYKSFVDEMVFSMVPAPKQKGLDYSVFSMEAGRKKYRGLCSAVIYGPNASGKTNVIGAMDTLRSIVLRGHINNTDNVSSNAASSSLELIPNCNGEIAPTEFAIRFVDKGLFIDYSIKVALGAFLTKDYPRKILEEKLSVNEKMIFFRNDHLDIKLSAVIKAYLNKGIKNNTVKTQEIAENNLVDTELFLNNGFKSIFAQKLVTAITDWFAYKFIVVCHAEDMRVVRKFADPKSNTIYVEKTLTEAAKAFGITGNALGYKSNADQNSDDVTLVSILKDKILPAEVFESYGTIRFINEFPLVIMALLSGATLVMDEFDASIHPMALMNIINIFHNDEINKNGSQLIFNTHNPIFLDATLLRRDEIKFVEREEATGNSIHYALSDFRTADGIRKGEDYMNNYFVSRYGAIRDVDFSPILSAIIGESKVVKDE